MTLDEDRADVERIAVSWQDVPRPEQQVMLGELGRMRGHLGDSDVHYQLRLDIERLIPMIESALGQG